ncbi:hypothetical protein B0H66DRAFT_539517 [Apodospora peruviana]|uniref:Pyridine nucleotide-disulfide oxidoreductase family protein n=1 Tax=Apodospora peruviana TaxID=516989 RepID=A0AAE0MEJ7_9PEZI|nr:hypothetical protein B0H66DRAFT_539517 [Apodospora peruviana]
MTGVATNSTIMASEGSDSQSGSDDCNISLGPTCHVQTAENRFGLHVLEDLKSFVFDDVHANNAMDFDDDDDNDDDNDELDDDDDDGNIDGDLFFPSSELSPEELMVLLEESVAWQVGQYDHIENASPEGGGAHSSSQGFPRVARLRCNLTALSQRYNLYFTAYQDKIYVYQPRAPPQVLPPPSIILHPRRTKAARMFGGVIDRGFSHQMNQLLVGNLGKFEVILFVFDDGDVGAYYTHAIARAVIANNEHRKNLCGGAVSRLVVPKEFFHENVGQSAWGVAIHEKSRLLAVSSNRHEVTVFAFAMRNPPARTETDLDAEVDGSPKVWSGQTALQLEKHFRSRTRTWRIVLPLGPSGNNIPTIAFVENEAGEADQVVALDVNGNTWILDIWKIGSNPILYSPNIVRGAPPRYSGWGVLVLPDSSFRQTRTIRESLGLPAGEIAPSDIPNRTMCPGRQGSDRWLDTTCSLYYVKDLAPDPEKVLRNRYGPVYSKIHADKYRPKISTTTMVDVEVEADEDEEDEDDDTDMSDSPSGGSDVSFDTGSPLFAPQGPSVKEITATENRWATVSKFPGPKGSTLDDLDNDVHLIRTIVPSFGQTPLLDGSMGCLIEFVSRSLDRQSKSRPVSLENAQFHPWVAKNLSILRTTTTDIELHPLDSAGTGIMCKAVLTHHNHHKRRVEPYDLSAPVSERTSMLVHVPELSLVVAGALNGRVAILTLTKTNKHLHGMSWRRGFRVNWVLPRKEEEDKRLRPWCALHGIAVSPYPERRARGLELFGDTNRFTPPGKYRLILHYMDHTILVYDIERRGEDVLIF